MQQAIGETDLKKLLTGMSPHLNEGEYVYCQLPDNIQLPMDIVIAFFREQEGNTFILSKENADQLSLNYQYIAAWITLTIQSSLDAVGLTAAVAQALATANISCNVVAAYSHDHIFVRSEDATKAMAVLKSIVK
ncbi:ACT domain-containing protein [Entomomonas sp. E2T0]|uniref:ACT domain-containing protein n=1 Tax=Entomomonas sp. E2T0 TaxID=2930213 RepID=UPI0022283D4E|nr:ACT domain-containing protein [Entomomonas sp. E2T0]UYZ82847.1 ACT domain-containing protein [Entomomonas sp. E2T0]